MATLTPVGDPPAPLSPYEPNFHRTADGYQSVLRRILVGMKSLLLHGLACMTSVAGRLRPQPEAPHAGRAHLPRAEDGGPASAYNPQPSAETPECHAAGADGTPLHAFRTLLEDLATVTRNLCRTRGQTDTRQTEFELDTQPSAEEARVLELLKGMRV